MSWILPRDSLFEVIFGPVLWTIFFLAAYTIVGPGCDLGIQNFRIAGFNGARVLLVTAAAVTSIVLLIGAIAAFRHWREAVREHPDVSEPRKDRRQFLSLASLGLIGLAFVGTVWVTGAMLLVPMC